LAIDPSDIEAIVRGLTAALGPNILYGYIAAAATSVLITLALTIPQGAKKVEKKMLDPNGKVAQARAKEIAAFKTEVAATFDDKLKVLKVPVPDLAPFEKKVDGVIAWANGVTPLLNNLTAENLEELMGKVLSNHRQAAVARGDGAAGAPPALEGAMADAEWAVSNPDQAQALAIAHQTIDSLAPVFNWDAKKTKQLHSQANAARGNIENLQAIIQRLQALEAARGGTGGGQSGGGVRRIGT